MLAVGHLTSLLVYRILRSAVALAIAAVLRSVARLT